ncbi:hypothetical protein [Sphingobacterium sp. UGAL515B_05]|uniref:hypothetical protein n=1 Tax=Sphingobacterium sp. UGAL515B_05 TaxID=2986767 RepID=UPI0029542D93|nr:hypothetical protein [Sphingobacterium sp. UGAL515B_05]WON93859.1 hypothetical protein OK025_21740 [Sphingobacterium sp. UGAL515B_05]
MNIYNAFALLLGLFSIQACINPSSQQSRGLSDTIKTSDTLPQVTVGSNVAADSSKGQIFLVRSYRIWEKEDPTTVLDKDWFDLYEENGKYYLEKVDYEIKDGFDDCAQVPTKNVESRRNSVLFLKLKGLQAGSIENVKVAHSEIWPKESVEYSFKNQKVTLKALGTIKSTEIQTDEKGHEKLFHEVTNYKLNYILNKENKEKTLFQVDQYDDVFMSTLFVGDIDRDGALDFIFSNPNNYEEEAMFLFLSNHGNALTFEADVQFDC